MSGRHAKFAPSSAHRVIVCPASFLFTQDMPSPPSFEAVEGSVAHYVHEQCLLHGVKAEKFAGMSPHQFMDRHELDEDEWALLKWSQGLRDDDFIFTREMAEYVQESVDRCMAIDTPHRFVEQRLSISDYTPIPDQFGTSDHIAISPNVVHMRKDGTCLAEDHTLFVDDLKFGKGVKVYAERNYQAILYALGVLSAYDFLFDIRRVVIRIMQPRLDHYDEWATTPEELYQIGAYIKERFTLALQPGAPFHPDEKACKFCPGKATCPALAQRAQELALGMFDDLDADIAKPEERTWPLSGPSVIGITPEQIGAILEHRDLIIDFLDAVKAQAEHRLLHGEPVPGFKLVVGRSNRIIKSVAGYETYLRENGVDPFRPREVITITSAESALKSKEKKAGLAAFLDKPPGRPTLARESDKREAYTATANTMFAELPSDDDL